ncbi:MAG: iron transporter [Synergistaceae bacterium]|nr:iron transporter [Synergistaceae bacterium]
MKRLVLVAMILALATGTAFAAGVAAPMTMKPGEVGFEEIPIGETQVGPYNVAAVYFQAVDMYPVGKNPSREDSDMHLEADIHLKPEAAIAYGFGNGEDIWPAYLTVKYEIAKIDGKVVMDGSFMPMNADDGPHYGANIKKGLAVGPYKLRFIIEPPSDYLLHTDDETGVPAKEDAKNFFQTYTVEFDWNYTGEQLQND